MLRELFAATAIAVLLGAAGNAQAGYIAYQGATGYANFVSRAGSLPTVINFESTTGDIANRTIAGVTFSSPSGNSLDVLAGAATYTLPDDFAQGGFTNNLTPQAYKLLPTSGTNVLSPGGALLGPGPGLAQEDALRFRFAQPQRAFGFDMLYQSLDANTRATYEAYDDLGRLAFYGPLVACQGCGNNPAALNGAPGGSNFFGLVAIDTARPIQEVIVRDNDPDRINPDANLGYDTFRFTPFSGFENAAPTATLQGGASDHPVLIPIGQYGAIAGSISGAYGPVQYYQFDWGGGQFDANAFLSGANPQANFSFELLSPSGVILQTAVLDAANNFNGLISDVLAAGAYTIGLRTTNQFDPDFTISFSGVISGIAPSPAGVPEPTSWALMVLGFGGLGGLLRRRRRAGPRLSPG